MQVLTLQGIHVLQIYRNFTGHVDGFLPGLNVLPYAYGPLGLLFYTKCNKVAPSFDGLTVSVMHIGSHDFRIFRLYID